MKARRSDIVIGVLGAIVVGVAAIGVAMGLPGLQPPPQAATEGPDAQLRYACSADHASFTIADLVNAPAAGVRADPALDALRALIDEQARLEEGEIGADGWHRVVDSPEEVVFMAATPDSEAPYSVVHVVPGDVGVIAVNGWAVDSYGSCTPRPVVPEALSVADWWVDASAEPIGPDSDAIRALVHETACASGQDATGRIEPPTVVYGPDTVTVTIIVRNVAGDADCQGNPLTPYTIELTEPLGARELLDGGQLPPGDPFADPDP